MTTIKRQFVVILLLLNATVYSTEQRSGIYRKTCEGMVVDLSSLSILLREIKVSSWYECVNQCLYNFKCASVTFNNQILNDNNCMLYSDETVRPGHSDTEITIKVGAFRNDIFWYLNNKIDDP